MPHTLADPSDTSVLLERLERLRPDTQRRWGRMSAHQVVCHLADAFKAVMGVRSTSRRASLLNRTVIRFIARHTPLDWPKGVPTMPEVDQEHGGTKPAEFAADVRELRGLVERFAAVPRDFEWERHPIFGRLTEREWLHWGYRHMDHHLRQFGL
jgi:hypothetical protein